MQRRFSRFADTVLGEPGIFRLMDDLDAALTGSQKLHMLGGGNPGNVGPVSEYFRRAFLRIGESADHFARVAGRYDGPAGNTQFRKAFAASLSAMYGWSLTESNVVLTQGSQNAFFLLLNLFSGPFPDGRGRKILFALSPEYIGYENSGLHENSLLAVPSKKIPLGDGFFRYTIDIERITQALQTGDIGAICISRPSNPTGGMLEDDEMKNLSSLARQFDVPLIVDGAYGDPMPGVVYGNGRPYYDDNTIFVLSLSKTGLPGIRTGIILAPADVCSVLERIQAVQHLAPGGLGPALVQEGITDGSFFKLCKEHLPAFYRERQRLAIDTLFNELEPDRDVQIHRPDGAFFLWAVFPRLTISTSELYLDLKKAGVLVVPGSYYYPGLPDDDRLSPEWEGQRSIRISYSQDLSTIQEGLSILCQVVREKNSRA